MDGAPAEVAERPRGGGAERIEMFAKPEMLGLLAVTLPLLAWFLWVSWRRRQRLIAGFVQSRLLAQLTVGVSKNRQQARQLLLVSAVSLTLLTLARPQFGAAWEEVKQRGLDIVVAVDLSRSMMARDLAPNRLSRAKLAALDLLNLARTDRIALIAFAGEAFVLCPLTLDDNAFTQAVNTLQVGVAPQGTTSLSNAIRAALSVFADRTDSHKVLVLLTDGEDQAPGAIDTAREAAAAGLRIYPVGVGTPEGDVLRIRRKEGITTYITDLDGNRVVSKLNEDRLREIAAVAGGHYLRLGGTATMESLYGTWLSALPKSDLSSRLRRQTIERFQWPLGLAVLLLALEMFISERKRVGRTTTILNATNRNLRKGVALLAILWVTPAGRADLKTARAAYWSGDFAGAQVEYERLLTQHPQDVRLLYNTGTAAFQNGQFERAIEALSAAIRSSEPEMLALAYYNLGNAWFRVGENRVLSAETIDDWGKAIDHYNSALKLAPKDRDAQFNRDLVAAKLQELKQDLAAHRQDDRQAAGGEGRGEAESDSDRPITPPDRQDEPESDSDEMENEPTDADSARPQTEIEPRQSPTSPSDAIGEGPRLVPSSGPEEDADSPSPPPEATSPPGDSAGTRPKLPTSLPGRMTPAQARQVLAAAQSEERPAPFVRARNSPPEGVPPRNW